MPNQINRGEPTPDAFVALLNAGYADRSNPYEPSTVRETIPGRNYISGDVSVTSGVMFHTAIAPSVHGQGLANTALSAGILTGMKRIAGTNGSGLTSTAPATIASPTANATRLYLVLHS